MSAVAAGERTCAACGRGFTGKAGRVLEGRPVCQVCANRLREPVPCAACGRPTRRPGRAPGLDGLLCEPCRTRETHATCRVCSRHRRVALVDDDGRAVCVGCAGETPATRRCPDCGGIVPGGGGALCPACGLRRWIARYVALNAELLDRPWVRALFLEFCAWEGLPRATPSLPRRLGVYARCFAAIGEGCAGPSEVSQERLLALLGAEGLRRNQPVVRFLAGRLALSWEPGRAEASVEAGRAEAVLAAANERPWGPALRAYRDHLARDAELRPKTVRFYLNAATGLLAQVGHGDVALLRQSDVDRYLRRKPGQRASLARFLAHVARVAGVQLALSSRKRRVDPKAREKALLREAKHLLDRLDGAASAGEGRAVAAAAVARVYAVPLSAVLALRRSEVAAEGSAVTLWPEGLAIELAPALAAALRRWASWNGGYLFPGRNGAQPLSSAAVRHHVPARPVTGRRRRRGVRRARSAGGAAAGRLGPPGAASAGQGRTQPTTQAENPRGGP